MSNVVRMDSAQVSSAEGMFYAALDGAPCKRKIRDSFATAAAAAGSFDFNMDLKGVNGYVYSVSYHDGRVTLCGRTGLSVSDDR